MPLTLVTGGEEFLVERAVAAVLAELRDQAAEHSVGQDAGLAVVTVASEDYVKGALDAVASPSLFGSLRAVVVQDAGTAGDELQSDLLRYLRDPAPDVALIVVHTGGPRGRKVLDALRQQGAHQVDCPVLRWESDKRGFVQREFGAAGRRATAEAVTALVDAVGSDLRELASACAQLVSDTQGLITEEVVETYHAGRVETTGFKIADAAVAGQVGEALRLLRHGLSTGLAPVVIVAALAYSLRTLARVGAAGRGSPEQLARSLGLTVAQARRATEALGGWRPEALGRAVQAVAEADFLLKGGAGPDSGFVVERAVLAMTRERSGEDASVGFGPTAATLVD